ncbi:MAG: arginine--tRNA ligase [Nitrososphaerota archaeon]|nr:arginine--tRNA ligase [Nitrososphaerota archaeon]
MTFKIVLDEARRILEKAVVELGVPRVQYNFSKPPSDQLGDLSSNVAFIIAKTSGGRPGEWAERIASKADLSSSIYFTGVTAHPGGYVNFHLNMKNFAEFTLKNVLSDGRYGLPQAEPKQRISVEHTSVNPAHPLHIGHLRNVVLGDSLVRLLRASGHQVYVLNYIDDTGLQVAVALLGILELGLSPEPMKGTKADHHVGEIYVEANRKVESDPALQEKRRRISQQLERNQEPTATAAKNIVDRVVRAQLETCWRIGAEYDLLNFESQILKTGLWDKVFERLKEKGVAKLAKDGKFDGCWIMEGGDENEEEKVLVRSDGTTVYAAKDIPYAAWKLGMLEDPFRYGVFAEHHGKKLWATSDSGNPNPPERFNVVQRTISVIGVEQSRPQKFVKAALLALSPRGSGYHHLAYGKVALSPKTAKQIESGISSEGPVSMKGRTGMYVTADDAMDALKIKAAAETKKRNPEASPEWVEDISESIAVGALRYELIKQDLNKPIVFDMDEALRLEGDTGPYLMYSYARARSVLRKSGSFDMQNMNTTPPSDLEPSEKNLILAISKTELELEEALKYLSPRVVANHAYSLAMSFNLFYEKCPIMTAPDVALRDWRLLLTDCFSIVLARIMDIIGVPHPESI